MNRAIVHWIKRMVSDRGLTLSKVSVAAQAVQQAKHVGKIVIQL